MARRLLYCKGMNHMDCKQARELGADSASGALEPSAKAELAAHLAGCEACRKEAELLSKAWQALDKYVAPELGEEFVASLMEKIKDGQAAQQDASGFSFSGWWKVPALTFASCAVYVVCVESGLFPQRQAADKHDGAGSIFAVFADSREAGGGNILSMMEGADK